MLQDKDTVDEYFQDNWIGTPIQYDGVHFKMPADGRWISLIFAPYDRQNLSTSGGLKVDYAIIRVNCYEKSVTKCYNLAHEVQQFLECKKIPTHDNKQLLVDMGIAEGQGATPLDNGVFETQLNFITKKYS